jgi:hypothetical protein
MYYFLVCYSCVVGGWGAIGFEGIHPARIVAGSRGGWQKSNFVGIANNG